jgi:lycopene cyclase domain-containing protein
MSYYTALVLIVIAGPLALSFDRRVAFYRDWPAVFGAIAIVLAVFGGWDVWKTAAAVWSFNPEYAGEWRFLHLPLGEWLFFVCVPYACLFILACVRGYFKDASFTAPRALWFALAAGFAAAGAVFMHKTYTGIVFLSVAAALVTAELAAPRSLRSRNFWVAMALTYIPFLISNGILTGKPVVLYDDTKNLALRLGTIPLEDFFYSFSMLLFSFTLYDAFKARLSRCRERRPHG